jgi:hypothetical protein
MPANSSPLKLSGAELLAGVCVALFIAGSDGEGKTSGSDRNIKDVRIEVTMSEHESPGFERSSMYQSAGLTRARVSVSCRVDCHGSRRFKTLALCLCKEGVKDLQ